jgi:hypothetical protein
MTLEGPITFNHKKEANNVIYSAKKIYKTEDCINDIEKSIQPAYVSEDFSYYT